LDSEKFKAISGIGKTNGLSLFYSKDGLNWFQRETLLVYANCKACFDSENILFWSEIEKKYVLYYRVWSNGYRCIAKRTSHGLSKWSEETLLFVYEQGEHLYTSGLFLYFREKSLYIGLQLDFFQKMEVQLI
jgi:hypothetical protein